MRSTRSVRRWAVLLSILLVLAGCGAGDGAEGGTGSGATNGCDAAAVAATLAPGSTLDFDPSESPADLAASTTVVFRASAIASIEVGDEWSTVTVEDVDIVVDARADRSPITRFGAFGAGIENRPDLDASAFEEMAAVVFAHGVPDAPGGLSAAIEGFWLQCPGELPVPVGAVPQGEAWHVASQSVDGSIDTIAAATAGEVPVGEVTIRSDHGDGWRLVDTQPGYGHPDEVAIMTSERALDRAADSHWLETRPRPDFGDEIVVILAPSVSGSCPAIIFQSLSITDDRVFGTFEPAPLPADTVCTGDANPVAFVFVVERQAVPDAFTLSVEEEVTCRGCERGQIDVDLTDEAALELALWGPGTLDVVIDGTPPADRTANVFRWDPEAASIMSADVFTDLPRWIQSFPSSEARTIEGFVVDCGAGGCPEECDDQSCQEFTPLGDVCTYAYEPEPFVDRTVTITWNGVDCEITTTPDRADK